MKNATENRPNQKSLYYKAAARPSEWSHMELGYCSNISARDRAMKLNVITTNYIVYVMNREKIFSNSNRKCRLETKKIHFIIHLFAS